MGMGAERLYHPGRNLCQQAVQCAALDRPVRMGVPDLGD